MRIAVLICILAAITAVGYAQGPPPGGGQGPNAGAMKAFQDKYKYTFQLTRFVGNIREIDQDKKYTLTVAQASKVLAILKPLRSKPKMTQDQAKKTLTALKKIFTTKQLNAMARVKPRFGSGQRPGGGGNGNGGNRPPGGGPPGGGGGGGGGQHRFDPNAMKDFNPFYVNPKATDEFAKRGAKRWNEFFDGLEKKAKPSKAGKK
jgi:uncharacterized membrane protein YgcG